MRHAPQKARAGPASSSEIGKNMSGSMPKHAALSCHMSGGEGFAGSMSRSSPAKRSALTSLPLRGDPPDGHAHPWDVIHNTHRPSGGRGPFGRFGDGPMGG